MDSEPQTLRTLETRSLGNRYRLQLDLFDVPAGTTDQWSTTAAAGRLVIFRRGTNRRLQSFRLPAIGPRLLDPEYEFQVSWSDLNFDGHDDFAVHVGDTGPYGSATYAVYLFSPSTHRFRHSVALSELTAQYIHVEADRGRRRLVASSKSGCCIHWTSEYAVVNDKPVLKRTETRDSIDEDRCELTVEVRQPNGRLHRTRSRCPQQP